MVIKHRNHLTIRSLNVILVNGTLGTVIPAMYDFSTVQSQAYQKPGITSNPAMKALSANNDKDFLLSVSGSSQVGVLQDINSF